MTDLKSRVSEEVWDYPNAHLFLQPVKDKHIDVMGHVNNVIYLRWMERVAWDHSSSLGLDWAAYERLDRAMVARHTEIDYLAAALKDDELLLATWITQNDRRISITREYQIVRISDGKTLLRGMTKWACVSISSGALKRMPEEFVDSYKITIPESMQKKAD